jgi:hypothetical protein
MGVFKMKRFTVYLILWMTAFALLLAGFNLSASEKDIGLWLARSCIGEAGWRSAKTGECAAIAHVYKKRQRFNKLDYYKTMRLYSSALKKKKRNANRWVRHLSRDLEQPKGWPKTVSWKRYKPRWVEALEVADAFLLGDVKDPLPRALHYGCHADAYRAKNAGWIEMKTGFRNFFYKVRGVK